MDEGVSLLNKPGTSCDAEEEGDVLELELIVRIREGEPQVTHLKLTDKIPSNIKDAFPNLRKLEVRPPNPMSAGEKLSLLIPVYSESRTDENLLATPIEIDYGAAAIDSSSVNLD